MKNDCFYILSREPNTPRRGYSSPFDSPTQMWTVLAQPRYLRPTVVKSDECQIRDFLFYFQMKPQTHAAHCVCFYCGNALEDPWCFFLEELVRFYAPPASTRGAEKAADSAVVAASVAAPHREGRPWRHAPHWLVKATSGRWGGRRTETGIKRWIWRYC